MNVLFQTKKDDKLRNAYLDIFKDGRSVCIFLLFPLLFISKDVSFKKKFKKMGTVTCEPIINK